MSETKEFELKKETDFVLIKSNALISEQGLNVGFDVVFENNLNGVRTLKEFRVFHMEQLKVVMSSSEIDEILKR